MNDASLQGGYKLPECNDSEESFGMLVSALVMFLKYWLSNQWGTEGVMQSWCIFPPVGVPDSLLFCCLGFIKKLVWSSAAKKCTSSCTQWSSVGKCMYHRSGSLLYTTRT